MGSCNTKNQQVRCCLRERSQVQHPKRQIYASPKSDFQLLDDIPRRPSNSRQLSKQLSNQLPKQSEHTYEMRHIHAREKFTGGTFIHKILLGVAAN